MEKEIRIWPIQKKYPSSPSDDSKKVIQMETAMTTRERDAKRNIYISLICQVITIFCGLVTPRCLLLAFGSEVNGAVSSIATFLGYITLLEGGIAGVARASLYKPIAENDQERIGKIYFEIQRFFQRIGIFFAVYVLILAFSFKTISHIEALDSATSFWLVIVISISTFAQYFIGITNTILITAEQKLYVINLINILGTIANTVCIVLLTKAGCGIITVRLVSSIVFAIKPVLLAVYVKKKFGIIPIRNNENQLKDKWVGLGQHLAYFFHSNTDIVVLTLFGNLKAVSVYGIYSLVTSSIQNIASSFFSGIESLFGDMYAKEEYDVLNQTFDMYETMISVVSTVLYSITMVMIVPFVKLYTAGVNDANYIEPLFSVLLCAAGAIYCQRAPYHNLVIAAGHFKQTNAASYGETIINIALSIVLVIKWGLIGVAIGTVVAMAYRTIYYVVYLSKRIVYRTPRKFIKHIVVNSCTIAIVYLIGNKMVRRNECMSFFNWVICSCIVGCIALIVCVLTNCILFRVDCRRLYAKLHTR